MTDQPGEWLRTECLKRESSGLERIILTIRRKSKPKNWDRIRVAPGLYGRCVGELDDGRYVIDTKVCDVLEMFERMDRVQP